MLFDESLVNLFYGLPFFFVLLAIALGPLLLGDDWHKYCFKITLCLALSSLITLGAAFGLGEMGHAVVHTILHEYLPFIILIGALFTITGGIHIAIYGHATPVVNVIFLAVGSLLASIIGTTGAAMLLIRPLIQLNRFRRKKAHLVIFFIFTVANIGGSLTPIGDPPLFLGYLYGVPFLWPLVNLMKPFLMVIVPLLGIFYLVDRYLFSHDPRVPEPEEVTADARFSITGRINFALLAGVILTIAISGSWHDAPPIGFFELKFNNILRDVMLVGFAVLSWQLTSGTVRHYNGFNWEPLREVAEVFFAIFVTIIPVIAMLKQGASGPFASLLTVANPDGVPNNSLYFWLTGGLSAFLDNAPTYLVFFNLAGGNPGELTSSLNQTLIAISTGAVFMGAMTYIGNAPNFMVRAIAEKSGIKMPSFFGYMLWSVIILLPVLLVMARLLF